MHAQYGLRIVSVLVGRTTTNSPVRIRHWPLHEKGNVMNDNRTYEQKERDAKNAIRRAQYFCDTCGNMQREAANRMVEKRKAALAELRNSPEMGM
jgi:hypothetical protein